MSTLDSLGNGFQNGFLYIGGTSTGYTQSSVYVFTNAEGNFASAICNN